MRTCLLIILILFFGNGLSLSQQITVQQKLLKRTNENYKAFFDNPEKAFNEAKSLEKEAYHLKDEESELLAINTQYLYYKTKNEIERGISEAKKLNDKSLQYHNYTYQIYAAAWIADYYIYNKLYDLAFTELETGLKTLRNLNQNDYFAVKARTNLYLAYSNYYLLAKQDYQNQLKYVKLAIKETNILPDKPQREKQRFLDYSNLATVYYKINADSAKYYALLSISKEEHNNRSDIRFNNFLILGMVEKDKNNLRKAIEYFLEAEKNASIKNNNSIPDLYDNIIETYKGLKRRDESVKYIAKRDSLKLEISETRNNSLYKTLEEEKEKKSSNKYYYLFSVLSMIIVVSIIFLFLRKRKYIRQSFPELPKSENYTKLLEMLKRNDPAFVPYFNEVFPEFNNKLLKINPKLISSELEFCALLKLKIPTHNIAQYINITTKSVQNKKYYIRKKLNIPSETDIYNWFSEI
ncbi:helix-turn-helix transcriptional regulator [Epilithonimonas caeni]|uniref:helix-turn-helix transcriptional regulator n=1 Tax=Epilithonimonas caeni TaxID=365343 RepID=UPI0004856753|nr:hypothetical protein [Epilithonimonas caeni]